MTLHRDVKINLVEGINQEAQVPLDVNGLIFSRFQLVDEEDHERLRIRITGKDDYRYRGTEVITFRRLNLGDLNNLLLQPPRMYPENTLYDMLDQFKTVLGISLTVDDIEDSPVIEQQGSFYVTLKAKPESLGWYGEGVLEFLDLPPITIPINETVIRW